MTHRSRVAVLTLVAMTSLTACSDDAPAGAPGPSGTPSETATTTPTPTSTHTPTQRPLSRFEDEPVVKVARAFSAGLGRTINDEDESLRAVARYLTKDGREDVLRLAQGDFGLYFPGPNPFTPVRVNVAGGTALLDVCWWAQGWAQDPQTKQPASPRSVMPTRLAFAKIDGSWKLDDGRNSDFDCSGVSVKGRGW